MRLVDDCRVPNLSSAVLYSSEVFENSAEVLGSIGRRDMQVLGAKDRRLSQRSDCTLWRGLYEFKPETSADLNQQISHVVDIQPRSILLIPQP